MNVPAATVALVPPEVVTVTAIGPAVVVTGVVALTWEAETTVTAVPALVPNFTAVVPVKFVPVIVTAVPPATGPVAGLMLVIVGAATAVICRAAVVPAPAVAVGDTDSRKNHTPAVGAAYDAVYEPVVLVVPVAVVVQVLEEEGRRCTLTVRATYPVPVLTETASLIVYPTATLAEVLTHPDTVVAAPVIPVTFRAVDALAAALAVAGAISRKYHTPVPGTV